MPQLEQPRYAQQIFGQSRARWFYRGKAYTAHGVEVPENVRIGDEELFEAGKEVGTDEQVLDMVVTMPADVLPPGFELSPISEQPAIKPVDDKRAINRTKDATPLRPSVEPPPVVSEAVAQQRAARGQK